ncbi:unnamed protein product [Alternaria alternata]
MDVVSEEMTEGFVCSRWWTRAWTLQELVAPTNVQFYNALWQRIGSKTASISIITSVTGIDEETLRSPRRMFDKSIAQRLSWAASRKAKRTEDRTYSLIGLLGVRGMAMQYGEGSGAFTRLQELILQDNNDQTLFAWNFVPKTISKIHEIDNHEIADSSASLEAGSGSLKNSEDRRTKSDQIDQEPKLYMDESRLCPSPDGLFAMDPDCFRCCSGVVFQDIHGFGSDLIKLNGAWRMNMPIVHVKARRMTYQVGLLPCSYVGRPYHLLGILLYSWNGSNRYHRISLRRQIFTFLVNTALIGDYHVERLWIEGFEKAKSLGKQDMKDYRSIRIRIKTDQDDWCFTTATPKEATWSATDMVLRCSLHLFDKRKAQDHVLLSSKYRTCAQINFALGLPTLLALQSPAGGELDKSRIVVFVGDQSDEDWALRLKQMWDEIDNAENSTPKWTIQASITTRRVFNQLMSTLEITDTESALDHDKLREAIWFIRSQGKRLSAIDRIDREWRRMRHALHACQVGGAV